MRLLKSNKASSGSSDASNSDYALPDSLGWQIFYGIISAIILLGVLFLLRCIYQYLSFSMQGSYQRIPGKGRRSRKQGGLTLSEEDDVDEDDDFEAGYEEDDEGDFAGKKKDNVYGTMDKVTYLGGSRSGDMNEYQELDAGYESDEGERSDELEGPERINRSEVEEIYKLPESP